MNDFETTIDRISKEQDPAARSRVEQFIVETVRALPNLTTKQGASLAIQLLDAVQLADAAGTKGVRRQAMLHRCLTPLTR